MGVAAIFGFSLKLFHLLAWPLLALGYPLHASIVAIETNSNADSQKLVTYWILFSIISLVEHALGSLLVWLPFWVYMKVSLMLWLIIPHFDGAFYVYKHLVHPFLSMSSQAIIDGFKKQKELSLKREGFLVEAEKYLNENGPEALEKLLSSQSRYKDAIVSQKYIIAAEVKEKKEVTAAEPISEEPTVSHKDIRFIAAGKREEKEEAQLKHHEATCARKDIEAVELKEYKEMAVEGKVDRTVTNLTDQNGIKFGSVEIKETPNGTKEHANIPSAEINKTPNGTKEHANVPDPKEAQREWTCAICQVTTNNESVLKSHLQGKKHKAAFEALKVKKQPFVLKKQPFVSKDTQKAKKSDHLPKQESCTSANVGGKQKMTKMPKEKTGWGISQAAPWCNICDITCSGAGNFVEHCRGKKHMARIQELTGSVDSEAVGVTGWE